MQAATAWPARAQIVGTAPHAWVQLLLTLEMAVQVLA